MISYLVYSKARFSRNMLQNILKNVHPQVLVFLGSTSLLAICAYPVFAKEERAGHDLFSSDRPEAIREAQEAKRDEYRQLIKEQRKQMQADQDSLKLKQQEKNQR